MKIPVCNSKNPKFVTDGMIETLKGKNIPYAVAYGNCIVCDETKTTLCCGKSHLNDMEVIFSYAEAVEQAKENDIQVMFAGKLDLSVLLNQEIKLDGSENKIVKVAGIEKKLEKPLDEKINQNFDNLSKYTYMNQNTFNAINYQIGEREMIEFFTVNSSTGISRMIFKTFSYELSEGRMPENENEIVISRNFASDFNVSLSNDATCKILTGKKEYNTIVESKELTVVGITDADTTSVYFYNESTFNDVALLAQESQEKLYRKIELFTDECTASQISYLEKMSLTDSTLFHNSLATTEGVMTTAGIILLIVIIPLGGLMVFMQMVNAKQQIVSQKRTIGILKSISFSNKKISKLLIVDSLMDNGIAFIIALMVSPLLISIINSVLVDKGFCFMSWLNYQPLLVIMLFSLIILVSLISLPVSLSRLNKKTDIELVYEK